MTPFLRLCNQKSSDGDDDENDNGINENDNAQ